MKRTIQWSEWVARVRQDVDPLEDMGEPHTVDADGDPLDVDLFLDTLAELERRGIPKDSLVAVLAPKQIAALLVGINFLEKQPDALDDEGYELPNDMTLYGVPIRGESGFPAGTMVLFDPNAVSMSGVATYPSGIAVVENLQVPDLDDPDISTAEVRRSLSPGRDPEGSSAEDGSTGDPMPTGQADAEEERGPPGVGRSGQDDEDPERRGTRFVEEPDGEGDA